MRVFATAIVIAFLAAGFFACDKNKKKDIAQVTILPGETAQSVFARAEKLFKKKKYEEAINDFEAVRNYFPQSEEAIEAELQVGEAYLAWRQYGQAADAYRRFRRLHPLHPRSDYALLRQGEAYFKDAPKTIDRDLTSCESAVVVFDEFFQRYPDSTYAAQARDMSLGCRKKLAGREYYIGRFYYRTHRYKAAAGRFEDLLRDHTGYGYDEKAAWLLARSYWKLEAYEDTERVLRHLIEHFPESKDQGRVQKLLAQSEKRKQTHETTIDKAKDESETRARP